VGRVDILMFGCGVIVILIGVCWFRRMRWWLLMLTATREEFIIEDD
jgi:hypothetical protein